MVGSSVLAEVWRLGIFWLAAIITFLSVSWYLDDCRRTEEFEMQWNKLEISFCSTKSGCKTQTFRGHVFVVVCHDHHDHHDRHCHHRFHQPVEKVQGDDPDKGGEDYLSCQWIQL